MAMTSEPQLKRKGSVAYPCVACGSLVDFDQVYCAPCLRAMAEKHPEVSQDPDAILERLWLRSQIENERAA
jgi:predicted Fe-S protein YdhL (DUF1289 family)